MIRETFLLGAITLALIVATGLAQQRGGFGGPMRGGMMGNLPREMGSDANPMTQAMTQAKIDLGRMLFYG